MYGKELPVAKTRKSKRKDLSEEEYLAEEQPSKKTKSSTSIKAPEEGGSGLQQIQEEQVEGVLGKRSRESQEAGPSPTQAPRIPKMPRKKAIRKLEYTSEEERESGEMVDNLQMRLQKSW